MAPDPFDKGEARKGVVDLLREHSITLVAESLRLRAESAEIITASRQLRDKLTKGQE